MKQHITEKQYEEIGIKKLKKAFKEYGYVAEDITIGRMIVFLDEHYDLLTISKGQLSGSWYISDRGKKEQGLPKISDGLVDRLWEAIKIELQ